MSKELRFSIQKFEAVDLHYIFRIQFEGRIMSWAVPKGPSPDPRIKRLAIPIDSSIALEFEGIVKEKNAKVILWDSGPFHVFSLDNKTLTVAEGLRDGHLSIRLEGKKLQGGFSLLRIDEGSDERWFLMKMFDDKATSMRNPVVTEPLSIISGKSVEEIAD